MVMTKLDPETAHIGFDYVILGGTGDLAFRKIYPSFFNLMLNGSLSKDARLLVVSRGMIEVDVFSKQLTKELRQSGKFDAEQMSKVRDFLSLFSFLKLDIMAGDGRSELRSWLHQKNDEGRVRLFYLSISPTLFEHACELIGSLELQTEYVRIVVEKPLGSDTRSAIRINTKIRDIVPETQIYRIDHYLGKETVQNLMVLRFANVIFEALWRNVYIDFVQISVLESVGLEGRTDYYDQYGAIKDMVQNHLLQLLCLTAMEPPSQFQAGTVRDEKLRVLHALRDPVSSDVLLGQYEGYSREVGKQSQTETFVATRVFIDNWRWAGVPFYLRTGKRIYERRSEIVIGFKSIPHNIFSGMPHGDIIPNKLIIQLQPEEGIRLAMMSKKPGPGGMNVLPTDLMLNFKESYKSIPLAAYERLLLDTVRGNQTLFMRFDEVVAAWSFTDKLLQKTCNVSPVLYRQASAGPPMPADFFMMQQHVWQDQ